MRVLRTELVKLWPDAVVVAAFALAAVAWGAERAAEWLWKGTDDRK